MVKMVKIDSEILKTAIFVKISNRQNLMITILSVSKSNNASNARIRKMLQKIIIISRAAMFRFHVRSISTFYFDVIFFVFCTEYNGKT